jgi:hypothetical protein
MELKEHTIYGIILFLILLGLIYLLNKKNDSSSITEGFIGEDNFIIYEKAYFDLDMKQSLKEKTIADILNSCMKDKNCKGVTFDTEDNYYIIKNTNTCYSTFLGSGIQKADAVNYTTYLKKTVPVSDKLCITSSLIDSTFFTIGNKNKLYLCAIDNQLYGIDKNKIQFNKMYENCRFKIINGLYSSLNNQTISIKLETTGSEGNLCLTHNFPRSKNLLFKYIKSSDTDAIKKSATFRLVSGLSNEGFSFKLIDIPNTFLRFENQKNNTRVIVATIDNKNNIDTNDLATFYMNEEIEKVEITPETMEKEATYSNDLEETENDPVVSLTKEDKIKRMKNKNMSVLERQSLLLEEQNKKINSMELVHIGNIGKISREFANQSAQLALGKYLKEKNDMEILQKNNPDNTPSVEKFRGLL